MHDKDCVFCKIVKGEIPCHKMYENGKVIAFLDINPITEGHTLVIPRDHYKDFLDMPKDLINEVTSAAQRLAGKIVKAVGADGFNLGQNNGKAAGQVIMHFHLHLIPRFENDGLANWNVDEKAKQNLGKTLQRINESLKE